MEIRKCLAAGLSRMETCEDLISKGGDPVTVSNVLKGFPEPDAVRAFRYANYALFGLMFMPIITIIVAAFGGTSRVDFKAIWPLFLSLLAAIGVSKHWRRVYLAIGILYGTVGCVFIFGSLMHYDRGVSSMTVFVIILCALYSGLSFFLFKKLFPKIVLRK